MDVRAIRSSTGNSRLLRLIRRFVEYAITFGLALLSSYWIVHVPR